MLRLILAVAGACLAPAAVFGQARIELGWPVACNIGESCEIQHYVDHGEGRDFRCGVATYKGHDGTDIRLPNMEIQRSGVHVIAAAPGRVLRIRNDMTDVSVRLLGNRAVQGRECGNGLVIAHADDYETQYCHLAQDSLLVKSGDVVSAGQRLGRVGLSGETEFPHLHFTVRREGKVVDPFAVNSANDTCHGGLSLWKPVLRTSLEYKAGAVLNVGFVDRKITMEDIENGVGEETLTSGSPNIVAFVRTITLLKDDVQMIVLSGPDGLLVEHTAPPLASNKDQVFLEVGRKRPTGGWKAGAYNATYTVTRKDNVIIQRTFSRILSP